jgi:hypothetical protein
MVRAANPIDSPGIEPVPQPQETSAIGGRAETWSLPGPRDEEQSEPNIIRGTD